jgi:hypothetical protein
MILIQADGVNTMATKAATALSLGDHVTEGDLYNSLVISFKREGMPKRLMHGQFYFERMEVDGNQVFLVSGMVSGMDHFYGSTTTL